MTEAQLVIACERMYAMARQWPVQIRLHPIDCAAFRADAKLGFHVPGLELQLIVGGRVLRVIEDNQVPPQQAYLELEAVPA